MTEPRPAELAAVLDAVGAERRCHNCERCTWNPGPDCGKREHGHCERCGHCRGRHVYVMRVATYERLASMGLACGIAIGVCLALMAVCVFNLVRLVAI